MIKKLLSVLIIMMLLGGCSAPRGQQLEAKAQTDSESKRAPVESDEGSEYVDTVENKQSLYRSRNLLCKEIEDRLRMTIIAYKYSIDSL